MNIKILILIIFLFKPILSYSNDSNIEAVGGTWIVMKGEHPSVQMERETININVFQSYYNVEATFIFRNNGDSCSVFMGFPESGSGAIQCDPDSSCFISFSTSVNDETVNAVRIIAVNEESFYLAYWIKYVKFDRGETKKVKVNYCSPIGGAADTYNQFVDYKFSGGNWFGKVLESKLNLYFHIPIEINKNYDNGIKKESDHYTYYRTDWEAEDNFSVSFRALE
jgi:hypothetical protein